MAKTSCAETIESTSTTNITDLHLDVLLEIFKRLPVSSLLALKSTCKLFDTLIDRHRKHIAQRISCEELCITTFDDEILIVTELEGKKKSVREVSSGLQWLQPKTLSLEDCDFEKHSHLLEPHVRNLPYHIDKLILWNQNSEAFTNWLEWFKKFTTWESERNLRTRAFILNHS